MDGLLSGTYFGMTLIFFVKAAFIRVVDKTRFMVIEFVVSL
jgi:hypothetical protein